MDNFKLKDKKNHHFNTHISREIDHIFQFQFNIDIDLPISLPTLVLRIVFYQEYIVW